jgi:hypothetical protein
MKIGKKNFAVINIVYKIDVNPNSLVVKLNNVDIKIIYGILKKLKTDLSVEFVNVEMEMVTFDIFIDGDIQIKIVDNQLYIRRNNILEFLIDEQSLVKDIILDKATRKNYTGIKKVTQLIYSSNIIKAKVARKSFKQGIIDTKYRYQNMIKDYFIPLRILI